MTPKSFRKEIARARTYGYMRDVERLWAAGFALGSSLENSVVIGEGAVVNPEGLRYPDEFVRHKVLDTIGDLSLAGAPIRRPLSLAQRRPQAERAGAFRASSTPRRLDAVAEPAEREARPDSHAELSWPGGAGFRPGSALTRSDARPTGP